MHLKRTGGAVLLEHPTRNAPWRAHIAQTSGPSPSRLSENETVTVTVTVTTIPPTPRAAVAFDKQMNWADMTLAKDGT